jgi:hypothetical protein
LTRAEKAEAAQELARKEVHIAQQHGFEQTPTLNTVTPIY